jgi:nucleoside-diphosphate-sugar epimerase
MDDMEIIKKVLVTGSEGYIGSVLMPMLIKEDFKVTGLDRCFYSEGNLTNEILPEYRIVRKDIRDISPDDLEGFDSVVHLAALSNDPLGKLNEELTFQINYKASVKLARIAKSAGVKRFIFSSSCSLYGANNKILSENDKANPQTAYGKSKILAEEEIAELADINFSPVYLRNATAFGISPRMRFDIVVNNLIGYAKTEKVIRIFGDGSPWRPLVHVKDICKAIIFSLKAPKDVVHDQSFNIGSSNQNFQIKSIAEKIKTFYKECKIEIMKKDAGDTRNYIVSFDKAEKLLRFTPDYSLNRGIEEMKNSFEKINLTKELFDNRLYTRLKQIEYLINEGELNADLRQAEEKIIV